MGIDTRAGWGLPTIMKPLSGSGARGLMLDVMKENGPDSFVGRLVCLVQGASDTHFTSLRCTTVVSPYAAPDTLSVYVWSQTPGVRSAPHYCAITLHLNDDPTMNEYKNISIEDFDYLLPDERIAKYPLEKRSESKLLRYAGGEIEEYHLRSSLLTCFRRVPYSWSMTHV